MVELQTGDVGVVLKVRNDRNRDALDKLLGTFYEVLVSGQHMTISAIDIIRVIPNEAK